MFSPRNTHAVRNNGKVAGPPPGRPCTIQKLSNLDFWIIHHLCGMKIELKPEFYKNTCFFHLQSNITSRTISLSSSSLPVSRLFSVPVLCHLCLYGRNGRYILRDISKTAKLWFLLFFPLLHKIKLLFGVKGDRTNENISYEQYYHAKYTYIHFSILSPIQQARSLMNNCAEHMLHMNEK